MLVRKDINKPIEVCMLESGHADLQSGHTVGQNAVSVQFFNSKGRMTKTLDTCNNNYTFYFLDTPGNICSPESVDEPELCFSQAWN